MIVHISMLTRTHLEAFVELAKWRSIGAAARRSGRSRATYMRYLDELRQAFDAPMLLERKRGQRVGSLTPAGEELARRARLLLAHWDKWQVATADAVARAEATLRVGALPGAFDLIADVLTELRRDDPELPVRLIEYPEERLLDAVSSGAVDIAFGTRDPAGVPEGLQFERLGALPWAVILPEPMADAFPSVLRLSDLDGVPMIVMRAGAARERLDHHFAQYRGRPLVLDAAFQVGSTPRMVDMVARGFGPAVVSHFRLAFLPEGVVVRRLQDGPPPLSAGVFTRRGTVLYGAAEDFVVGARERFRELAGMPPQAKARPRRRRQRGSRG
jgi:DNA-binding transcriptional LysR family regulator